MHIVLFEPDIPWNTGNIGRTCLATGSQLHLVGRLGFSIDAAQVKRAGLDYWERVPLAQHADWDAFLQAIEPGAPLYFFSKKATKTYWEATFEPNSYLVFGCETKGLPAFFHQQYQNQMYRLPIVEGSVRSLNLSTAVGVALYEALRQTNVIPPATQPAGGRLKCGARGLPQ